MESWSRCIENIILRIDIRDLKQKEYTEKDFYEWITARTDIREKVTSWLERMENEGERAIKDAEKAKRFKEAGNVFFKKKEYAKSVKSYTESARYATFDNSDFSIAIANRSASFFHLDRYTTSLEDVELALSHGYPESASWKLLLRAAECHLKLREFKPAEENLMKLEKFLERVTNINESMKGIISKRAKDLSSQISQARKQHGDSSTTLTKNMPMLDPEDALPKNVDFPYAATSVEQKSSGSRGRCVVTKKPVKKGDTLFAEKPFAWVPVTHGNNVSLCAHCCGCMDDCLIPCRGCLDALYCSPKCWKEAWPYHQWECPGYHSGLWQQIGVSHLAYKILLVSTTTTDRRRFNDAQNLVTHVDKQDTRNVLSLGAASFLLTTYMEKNTNYFHDVDIKKCLVDKFDDPTRNFDVDLSTMEGKKLYVGSMILRHSLQMLTNAYAVSTVIGSSDESDQRERTLVVVQQQRIAAGVYPSASMVNHSCDPTVIHSFWRNYIVVKAAKDIPEGQEIFICYGPHFKHIAVSERQHNLEKIYCFSCRCDACTNPALDSYTERFDGLKCPKCSGSTRRFPHTDCYQCFDCKDLGVISPDDELEEAAQLYERGIDLANSEEWKQAIPCFKKSLAIRKKYLYEHNTDIAITYDALGQCYGMSGDWLESISYLEKSLATVEYRYGSDSLEVSNELNKITGVCSNYLGRATNRRTKDYRDTLEKFRRYSDRALEIVTIFNGPWSDIYQEINAKKEELSKLRHRI